MQSFRCPRDGFAVQLSGHLEDIGIHDSHYHFQELALNHCLHKYGQSTDFLGFLDMDEFVVPRSGKLLPILEQYAQVNSKDDDCDN